MIIWIGLNLSDIVVGNLTQITLSVPQIVGLNYKISKNLNKFK